MAVQLPRDKDGRHRGLGFVEFESHDCAQKALQEMDGKRINTREVRIDVFREKLPSGSGGLGFESDNLNKGAVR